MTADPIWFHPAPRPTEIPRAPDRPTAPQIALEIDGRPVTAPEGSTILDACRAEGIDTPTLCYLENLTPVNVCRVCVVELEGARVLAPACSRRVEAGMKVQTDSAARAHQPQARARAARLVGRPVDRAGGRGLHGALRRRPEPFRSAGGACRRR